MAIEIVLRPYRGPQDHPEMSRVAALVRQANGDPELGTAADMDASYSRYDQAALPRDCAIAEVDGAVVGYARATWEAMTDGTGQVGCVVFVDPDRVGGAVQRRLVGHAVDRATELVRRQGSDRPTVVRAFAHDADRDLAGALVQLGFGRVRAGAEMVRPTLEAIPDLALPEGFELRPIAAADRAMQRRVWEATTRAFDDSWGEEVPTEAGFEAWLRDPTYNPPLWRVAFHDGAIAGSILNYLGELEPDGGRTGFTEAITVQPEFRRRGLARALLAESLRAVRDAGATRAALGVDSQNPNQAQALYASMGYAVVSVSSVYELGPFPAGWDGPIVEATPRVGERVAGGEART